MKELSLHILDIVQNSIKANASLIEINIYEDISKNILTIIIKDNGTGIEESLLKRVTDPFATTRTTRKVGLGIPLFKMAAEETGGDFEIQSEVGVGTSVKAVFVHDNIDRQPVGNMAETIAMLVSGNCLIDFIYTRIVDGNKFVFDTREIKAVLGADVPLDNLEVVSWIKDYIQEGEKFQEKEI